MPQAAVATFAFWAGIFCDGHDARETVTLQETSERGDRTQTAHIFFEIEPELC
jgi:hypothetical protein